MDEMTGSDDLTGEVPDLARIDLLPYQRRIVRSNQRFTWSCWARQTGKSFALSLRRVVRGLRYRRTQLFLSAGMRQTRELMLKVRQHCQVLGVEAGPIESGRSNELHASATQIQLSRGGRLIGLPARPETVRGFTGDVLLDEFAMHADDRAIWAAIFPTVLRGRAELDVASTPKGRSNLFYHQQVIPMFARSTVSLPQAVRQGLDIDMEALRTAMADEELFRQEFLCEFLDESQAFLPHRVIAACEDPEVDKQPDWPALQQGQADLYAGIDVARKRDLTVIWLWRMQEPPAGLDAAARRNNWSLRCAGTIEMSDILFREQQEVIRRVLALRGVRRCCIDATGMGLPLAEWAQQECGRHRVEAVNFTAGVKAQMAGQLRRLAEEGRLRIPVDPAIRNDWHSVQRTVGAGGMLRLDAARTEGSHADRFWAAALGAYAAEAGAAGPVEYCSNGSLRFAREGTW
jgi:phage FluMu gp28-like protein